MSFPYEITSKNRDAFMKTHTVDCLSHTLLMPSETQTCYCSKTITSDFFVFSFTKNNKDFGMFIAGPSCGRKIIKNEELSMPSMFNPFISSLHIRHPYVINGDIKYVSTIKLTPLNKEICNLLNLYRCITRKDLEGSLLKVFKFIAANPQGNVFDNYIPYINDKVSLAVEESGSNTLQEYFENIARKNNKQFRRFEFPLFKSKLALILESSK